MLALIVSVMDTGSTSGIMVTRAPVQRGAAKLAEHYNIRTVEIESGSSLEFYKAKIKNQKSNQANQLARIRQVFLSSPIRNSLAQRFLARRFMATFCSAAVTRLYCNSAHSVGVDREVLPDCIAKVVVWA